MATQASQYPRRNRLFTRRELFVAFVVACVLCLIRLGLTNLHKTYLIEATIVPKQSELKIKPGSFRGLSKPEKHYYRRMYRTARDQSRTSFQTNLAILNSRQLISSYIVSHNLLPKLYPDRWDKQSQSWKAPKKGFIGSIISTVRGTYQAKAAEPRIMKTNAPSPQRAAKMLQKAIQFKHDFYTGLIYANMLWKDPQVGAELLNGIIEYSNHYIAQQERDQILKSIANIRKQLNQSQQILPVTQALLDQLEDLNLDLLLNNSAINKPFILLSSAIPPESPALRLPKLSSAIIGVAGFCVTLIFLLLRRLIKEQKAG